MGTPGAADEQSYFDDEAEDLRVSFDALLATNGEPRAFRRVLKSVLDNIYRVREYRQGPKGSRHEYWRIRDSSDAGKTTDGIAFLRGVLTHHLTRPVYPVTQPALLDVMRLDLECLDENHHWITADEILQVHVLSKFETDSFGFYRSHVAGESVTPTLDTAISFLLDDPRVQTLRHGVPTS